jgi:hypothetical protein
MKLVFLIVSIIFITACGGGSGDGNSNNNNTVQLTPEGIPVADTLWNNKTWDDLYWQ